MRILIACEESQTVCIEIRKRGHEAYSCDIIECSGGHPEWHIQGDVLEYLGKNKYNDFKGWDMIIAFPPCPYLTVTANRWFNIERYREKAIKRHADRKKAIEFFMKFANADCNKIVIENPIGIMSSEWRKPDQIIHPYYFGDPERKSTCLWIKGLNTLSYDKKNHVEPNIIKYKNGKGTDSKWHMETMNLPAKERSKARSKTFPGIAKAMAEQWTEDLNQTFIKHSSNKPIRMKFKLKQIMKRPKISDYTKDLLASYDQLSEFSCNQDKYTDQLEAERKWINVKDNPPIENNHYIVFDRNNDVKVYPAYWDGMQFGNYIRDYEWYVYPGVTHYKLLPVPLENQ